MIYFTSLSPVAQNAASGLVFLAAMAALFFFLYKYVCRRKIKSCLAQAAQLSALILLLSYCTADSGEEYTKKLPLALLIALPLLSLAYSTGGFLAERKRKKETLSSASIKQALDNLTSGVCFSDETGRIILINRTMERLFSSAIGSRPQMLSELENALEGDNAGIAKIQESPALYRFSDGSVWSIESVEMHSERLAGFKQTSADDVTELYNANKLIERENKKLKETNDEMQLMLEHLADRIREEETLKLKTQIHNDIGSSLIEITKIIEGKADGDMSRQLSELQRAVSYFSNNYETQAQPRSLEEAVLKAKKMGASLSFSGAELLNESTLRIVCAAADECVRNAINHAGGKAVFAKISKNESCTIIDFTNNGSVPSSDIKEGGGLSSLRRTVEEAGGKMSVTAKPEFRLRIELPGETEAYRND